MGNERKTEALTRNLLEANGYYGGSFIVEEQSSDNAIIDNLLQNASKSGNGKGKPEFIITSKDNKDLLIVIECKASVSNHKSEGLDKPKDYACDGAIHYASYLSKEYNVIAIGVSGETESELKIDTYYWEKCADTYIDLNLNAFRKLDEYLTIVDTTEDKIKELEVDLMNYAKVLHNEMRDYAKLSENEKPLLVSAILIGLQQDSFKLNYMHYDKDEIAEELLTAVKRVLDRGDIPSNKVETLMTVWQFIKAKGEFKKENETLGNITPLHHMITGIKEKVEPLVKRGEHNIDILGAFYGEFLRYTGGDGKGLGIVLTPRHITELFVDMAGVTKDTKVLDTCTGTAGILISAMRKMFQDAKGDNEAIENIKRNNLIGVEQQPNMYALACSNMILRGDGKSNLYLGSSITDEMVAKLKGYQADIGIINPPYSQKGEGLSELDFIEKMLDCLKDKGVGIAIVPMSCAIDTKKSVVKLKERILSKHTLEAVISMPPDLFNPVNVITCIMVFTAHKKHDPEVDSWFALWKDDGFAKAKNMGRVSVKNDWEEIKSNWLRMFKNRKEIVGTSVKKSVSAKDEWCAEAYMETDYTKLTPQMFEEELKKYIMFTKNLKDEIKGEGIIRWLD